MWTSSAAGGWHSYIILKTLIIDLNDPGYCLPQLSNIHTFWCRRCRWWIYISREDLAADMSEKLLKWYMRRQQVQAWWFLKGEGSNMQEEIHKELTDCKSSYCIILSCACASHENSWVKADVELGSFSVHSKSNAYPSVSAYPNFWLIWSRVGPIDLGSTVCIMTHWGKTVRSNYSSELGRGGHTELYIHSYKVVLTAATFYLVFPYETC